MNGVTHYSNQEKASSFNDFFINQCRIEDDGGHLPNIVQNFESQLDEIVLTPLEVKENIKNLNPRKATGPDLVHNRLLMASADTISPHLAMFFNRCLMEGRFPKLWKIAK